MMFRILTSLMLGMMVAASTSQAQEETSSPPEFIAAVIRIPDAGEGFDTTDIALVDVATGEMTNLTQTPHLNEHSPTWSPDGTQLAYTASPPMIAESDIYIMDVERRTIHPLTSSSEIKTDLEWSPDGSNLAYTVPVVRYNYPIGTIPLDGSDGLYIGDGVGPTWSPDGTQIAYETWVDHQLIIVDLASGNSTQVTDDVQVSDPDWSPDGWRIAFAENPEGYGDPNQLYILDLESGEFESVLAGREISYPDWSPDGRRIALSARVGDADDDILPQVIFILDVETGELSEPICSDCDQPAWRPMSGG
jgi:Tol biopolymer transport system component